MHEKEDISLSGIDHIAIAVTDLGAAIKLWRDTLSLPLKEIEEVPSQRVKVAIFEIGTARIELVAATSPDSPIAKSIARHGEGLHHIALRTENCEAALRELEKRGVSLIDKHEHLGAENARVGFLNPKSLGGVLIEIVERS